jgi:tRNA threonylcarbamoyladenosine biosynthesis protein TsaB
MKILAIDTATENCSAALRVGERVSEHEELLQRGAAERILPMVQDLLSGAGIALADLDAIAFGRGPGGFTGVRLAASITQGLAYGAGVPVVPVSNLRAVAQRALGEYPQVPAVLVCMDARMREVYWACFGRDPEGQAVLVGEEHVGAAAAVQLPAGWQPGATAGAGTGFAAYPELGGKVAAGVWAALRPRAAEILQLAVAEVCAGRVLDATAAVPVYLRDNVAHAGPSH